MSCTPVLQQDAFRGRNDNGDETTATWKGTGADNQNWTQNVDENFRIRLHVQVTNACAATNRTFQLEYSLNTGSGYGSYNSVNASSSVVRSSASPNVTDGATTTDQLTTGSGTFQGATAFDEVDGACGGGSLDIAASGHTEVEFCVQIRSADVANGNTIKLRVSATNLASWTAEPEITVSEAAINEGAYSSAGIATVNLVGASRAIATLSASGSATVTAVGRTFVPSAISSAGAATVNLSGGGIIASSFTSEAPATVNMVGQTLMAGAVSSEASATVNLTSITIGTGALSSTGVASVSIVSESAGGPVEAVFSSDGAATVNLTAQAIAAAALSSQAAATAALEAQSIFEAMVEAHGVATAALIAGGYFPTALLATGVASVAFVGIDASAPETEFAEYRIYQRRRRG